ncbi:MAG: hypothetical protein HY826_09420 [Actinobacteria bacterium]|nr:hypothetical protein [Actinomycetota bacterium]
MASLLVNRRLKSTTDRLRDARRELDVVGEQLLYIEDSAHEQAMQQHRAHLIAEIAKLEAKIDRLLDGRPR